jgi:hypothetical protein
LPVVLAMFDEPLLRSGVAALQAIGPACQAPTATATGIFFTLWKVRNLGESESVAKERHFRTESIAKSPKRPVVRR